MLDTRYWMLDKNSCSDLRFRSNEFLARSNEAKAIITSATKYARVSHSGESRNPGRAWMPDQVRHDGVSVSCCRFNKGEMRLEHYGRFSFFCEHPASSIEYRKRSGSFIRSYSRRIDSK
jgi:hypothetical protein